MKFSEMKYERPDIQKVARDFTALIHEFDTAENAATQQQTLDKINLLRNEFQTQASLASVRNSINTTDPFYEKEQEFFDNNEPTIKDLNVRFYHSLTVSKFRTELQQKFGAQLFRLAETNLKTFNPSVMDLLKEENRLGTEYTKLVAGAEVEFQGRKMNLSQLEAFMESTDRTVRQSANETKWKFFAQYEKQFDAIYDQLVKLRHRMAQQLGYKNFVELAYYRMSRTDYTATQVATFRQMVLDHVVPLAAALRERQRERIGVNKLKLYDWSHHFNSGNPKPQGTVDNILANGHEMYNELSPETKVFFDFMSDNELMDLVTKKGKAAGGYCTMFNSYKAPFIFSNFNGTIGDVNVLTHEAGHAFQCFQSRHFEVEEYYFPTMEACEIHSMSMEMLTYPWMNLFFGSDTEKYKFVHLSSNVLFLPYGVAVDEFQHLIYENPDITPSERRKIWLDMEHKYRPWVDYDGIDYLERGGFWQRQSHIYRSPFYYIDYCLAQVCAFQFWDRSLHDFKNTWSDYLKLCKAGGSKSFLELVRLAGLQSPFDSTLAAPLFHKVQNHLAEFKDKEM